MNSDRRRAVLRSVADLFVRLRDECETLALHVGRKRGAPIMRLSEESRTLGEEALLAAMPDGAVVYLDDEAHEVSLEFGRITLVVPNETPDSVVACLLKIAESMPPAEGPMRWTMDGLASAVVEANR